MKKLLRHKITRPKCPETCLFRFCLVYTITFLILFSVVQNAFAQTNFARVFKISFSEKKISDSAFLYSAVTNLTSRATILNYLTNTPHRLTERDVVIMRVENNGELNELKTRFRWALASACKVSGAQLFFFDGSDVTSNKESGLREMSVMHWKSPYERPRDLANTEFYLDEKFKGMGQAGLKNLIQKVSSIKPKYLGMAGSQYTSDHGYGFDETPFGKFEGEVYECLKMNHVKEVKLCDFPVFMANGKDFYERTKIDRK